MARHTLIAGLLTLGLAAGGYQTVISQTSGSGASVSGTVSSEAEGAMEGVLVSAKGVGSTITLTVVTDKQGRYIFPSDRLKPGPYQFAVRAAGYDLKSRTVADVVSGKTATVDLSLEKTKDLAAQLMNAEWVASWPGTAADKQFGSGCVTCHSLEPIVRTRYDAKQWISVLNRMALHPNGSTIAVPFDVPSSPKYAKDWGAWAPANPGTAATGSAHGLDDEGVPSVVSPRQAAQAEYLASINLSGDRASKAWPYSLKTFPRPTGDETRVIMTEYDLPRRSTNPHDAEVDAKGNVWYCDFSDGFIGRLNPRTGEVKEWTLPQVRPFPPFHAGCLDVALDAEGNPWFALMRQAAVAKFDTKTEKITTWSLPAEYNALGATVIMVAPTSAGKVWFGRLVQGGQGGLVATGVNMPSVHLLDPKTGKIASYPVAGGLYGLEAMRNGNAMIFSLGGGKIIEVDAKTGKNTEYAPPTPSSGPRRGQVDDQGRAWFAQYRSGRVGMFDPATKVIKEWALPPHQMGPSDPYSVALDKNGDAWSGGMYTDYVVRLNPSTGKITKYLMPTVNVNVRRMDVDRSGKPVVWIGENHGAKILKLEPLD